ncbi:MAG: 50S ribosomal protein L1 [Microgenomates group bacterium GW2011_GWC1_47_20]|uniref:Ribosomal protein n=1 Tax=Candidatus Amesbacteria bacterium GW2011_GWC2_45_19 TaxID=1618366 RepID=A0A0G1Q252_9BACT|nr:MAG: 50S ribosomal protein L1 [Candidatus Amesbacteria bacterium GW2011_GWC2_45_19]KKU68461.1 MAG: 50S ribosomal protein L1 [Microgenomates group bacterium GW2011_GWC1_47_20]
MGKKAVAIIGSVNEEELKKKQVEKLHQKKLRQGLPAGRQGKGERVVDTTAESLAELEVIEKKQQETVEAKKIKQARIRSKPYQAAKSKVTADHLYPISEAIKLLRDVSLTKFDATVELHLVLKEKGLSKEIELPHPTGFARRVAIADDATMAKIAAGKIDFDVLLASPADMPKLVKYAKVLGPRGLMPNPKNGTIVDNPAATAKKLAGSNTISVKTEKDAPLIHTVVGKLSMTDVQLIDNTSVILNSLFPKESISQISKAVLKSTMSPAIKLAVQS